MSYKYPAVLNDTELWLNLVADCYIQTLPTWHFNQFDEGAKWICLTSLADHQPMIVSFMYVIFAPNYTVRDGINIQIIFLPLAFHIIVVLIDSSYLNYIFDYWHCVFYFLSSYISTNNISFFTIYTQFHIIYLNFSIVTQFTSENL